MKYLIMSRSTSSANALGLWFEFLAEPALADDPAADRRCHLWNAGKQRRFEHSTIDYERTVKWIEREAAMNDGSLALNQIVVMVDRVDPTCLTAALDVSEVSARQFEQEWGNLLAMLILTFPEIYWVFGVLICNDKPTDWPDAHSLSALTERPRRESLFDPSGLVQWVKGKTMQGIPVRELSACAIDEEKSYAYLHAYTMYRFGFRAEVVTSWALMNELFGEDAKEKRATHGYSLLIEDMNLNFPDRPEDKHLSWPHMCDASNNSQKQRSENCPLLCRIDGSVRRILITSGAETDVDEPKIAEWKVFLDIRETSCVQLFRRIAKWVWNHNDRGFRDLEITKLKSTFFPRLWQAVCHPIITKWALSAATKGRILNKPAGGVFDLWAACALRRDNDLTFPKGFFLSRRQLRRLEMRRQSSIRLDDTFEWPSQKRTDDGHSAPGKLMLVAETLLRRSEVFSNEACTVKDFIKGATLATEALELLGGRTPTMSLIALGLKHQYEIQAECAFVGVGYHFSVEDRIVEIKRDVHSICSWFGKSKREESILSAQVSILNRLVLVLRGAGRFEEENECLVELRSLNRRLNFKQEKRFRLLKRPAYLLRRYAEFLMAYFPRFVGIMFLWLVCVWAVWALATVNGLTNPDPDSDLTSWQVAFAGTIDSLVGGNPADVTVHWALLVGSGLIALAGLFHFGVFVSYIYSFVSRK